ncbi:MAG TPA: tetratricopeptide repeat protein [Geomonas sp.]|nr:tetratricopeptide repeat protein [Geomonas sp.]
MHLLNRSKFHVALIIASVVIVYANTLHSPFYFDDFVNLIDTPLIKDLSRFFTDTASMQKDFGRRWFGYLSFALNYRLQGSQVTGYHLVNTAVHLCASLLVYWLARLTFITPFAMARDEDSRQRGAGFIPLFAALLFAVHPIQTQAVTYIVQRFASLAAMLYLLSLAGYVKSRLAWLQGGKVRAASVLWALVAVLAGILSLLTKESAFTLPLVIFLYEVLFLGGSARKKVVAGSLLFAVLGLAGIALESVRFGGLGKFLAFLDQATRLQTDLPRLDYLATQCRVIVTYLRLIVLPYGQQVDYDYPIYHTFLDAGVIACALLLCAILAAGIYCLFRSAGREERMAVPLRVASFGIFWFFIALSIESSIIPIVDVIFEHRMYLPCAGLFTAIASVVYLAGAARSKEAGWPERRVGAAACAALLILGVVTVARNHVWQNEIAFWEDNCQKSPAKGRVFQHLGTAAERHGDLDYAEEAYGKAIDLAPADPYSHLDFGRLLLLRGKLDLAMKQFQAVVELDPSMSEVYNNIGKIYELQGDQGKAIEQYRLAVKGKPYLAEPYCNIGDIYLKQNRLQEALEEYNKAVKNAPDRDLGYLKRGSALLAAGRKDEAVADFRRALQINPASSEAAKQLKQAGG